MMIELFCKALFAFSPVLFTSEPLLPVPFLLIFLQSLQGNQCFSCRVSKILSSSPIIQFQSPFIFLTFVTAASNFWYQNVYYIPESAVTNYCILCCLEQWNLLSNSFGNQKSKISFIEPKSRSCKGLIVPLALSIHSLPLQASSGCWHFLTCGCIITPASASIIILPVPIYLISLFIPLTRLYFTQGPDRSPH